MTGKKHPKLLFIPTASRDAEGYIKVARKHFGTRLGCKISTLELTKNPSKILAKKKILASDIVYVGGGNTLFMLKLWKRYGVKSLLRKALDKGTVLSGVSAGAICWFRYGNSDSRKEYIRLKCLGFFPLLLCPHYNVEKKRKPSLKKMMKNTPGMAIALDNCSALEIIGDKVRVITSKNNANAYKVYWKKGKYHQHNLAKNTLFSLAQIIEKEP